MSESFQMLLELQQVWLHGHFPGGSVTVPNHPVIEEPFPDLYLP